MSRAWRVVWLASLGIIPAKAKSKLLSEFSNSVISRAWETKSGLDFFHSLPCLILNCKREQHKEQDLYLLSTHRHELCLTFFDLLLRQ